MHATNTTDRQLTSPDLEPSHMPFKPNPSSSVHQLSRVQQLTLNTWRLAAAKLERVLDPFSVLEYAALHAVLAAARDVDDPVVLFARHATAHAELALITSLIGRTRHADLAYDVLDAAFLWRWNELVASGTGPDELPPLRPRSTAVNPQRKSRC
jgi:hypothetical protein